MKSLFIATVASCIIFLFRNSFLGTFVQSVETPLASPLIVFSGSSRAFVNMIVQQRVFPSKTVRELADLEHRYNQVIIDKQKLLKLEEENASLRKQFETIPDISRLFVPAVLILNTYPSVTVGESSGVAVGNIVMANGVFLGVVVSSSLQFSHVDLLDTFTQKIRAKIADNNAEGIVYAENGQVFMDQVSSEYEILSGEIIETVGSSSGMLPGMPIGVVSEVISTQESPTKKLRVKPLVTPKQNMMVFVLKTIEK